MKCTGYSYGMDGKRHDCTEEATGDHGLCADHLGTRILHLKQDIANDEHDMWFYLNDARAHKRHGHPRGNVVARVMDARYFGHSALNGKRELRRLEAQP